MCVYIYIYIYMCIYIHIYIHVNIYTRYVCTMYLHTLIPHKSSQQEMSHIFPFNLGLFQPSKNPKNNRERDREREREREGEREGERPRKKNYPLSLFSSPRIFKPFTETSAPGCLEDSSHHDFNARTLLKHRSIGILKPVNVERR